MSEYDQQQDWQDGEEIEIEAIGIDVSVQPIELYKVFKIANLVGGGGEAKHLIAEGYVAVNGELETRKRRKMYDGDFFEFNQEYYVVVCDAPVTEPELKSEAKSRAEVKAEAKAKQEKQAKQRKSSNNKNADKKVADHKVADKKAADKKATSSKKPKAAKSEKKSKPNKAAEKKPTSKNGLGRGGIEFF